LFGSLFWFPAEAHVENKQGLLYLICSNYTMARMIKPAGVPGEFKCRICQCMWSSYMENNIPCTDRTIRYGLHNFDFANPIPGIKIGN
jgi:hypothetical protein